MLIYAMDKLFNSGALHKELNIGINNLKNLKNLSICLGKCISKSVIEANILYLSQIE